MHPARSARATIFPVHVRLCSWSLPSGGFPRGPASGLMPAPRRPAAAQAPASPAALKQAGGVCAESQARADRDGTRHKGMSASGAIPQRAGMRETTTPREAAVTRIKSPARTTHPECLGQTDGPGGRGVFTGVPRVRRRRPAHRVHHRTGPHPKDPHAAREPLPPDCEDLAGQSTWPDR